MQSRWGSSDARRQLHLPVLIICRHTVILWNDEGLDYRNPNSIHQEQILSNILNGYYYTPASIPPQVQNFGDRLERYQLVVFIFDEDNEKICFPLGTSAALPLAPDGIPIQSENMVLFTWGNKSINYTPKFIYDHSFQYITIARYDSAVK